MKPLIINGTRLIGFSDKLTLTTLTLRQLFQTTGQGVSNPGNDLRRGIGYGNGIGKCSAELLKIDFEVIPVQKFPFVLQ